MKHALTILLAVCGVFVGLTTEQEQHVKRATQQARAEMRGAKIVREQPNSQRKVMAANLAWDTYSLAQYVCEMSVLLRVRHDVTVRWYDVDVNQWRVIAGVQMVIETQVPDDQEIVFLRGDGSVAKRVALGRVGRVEAISPARRFLVRESGDTP